MSEKDIIKGLEAIDESYRKQIVKIYIKGLEKSVKGLKASLAKENFKKTAFHAHKVKGSSRTIGLKGVAKAAEKLETYAKSEKTSGVKEKSKEVMADFALIKKISKRYFKI